ncbi:RNA recognition motif containing protein [Sarocladium implicatum]|nr:RNA recognition motif containing protein [Sarocladium implicatum]
MASHLPQLPFSGTYPSSRPRALQPSSLSRWNTTAKLDLDLREDPAIRITKVEHETLIELARRYTNLRTNLIALGADVELVERFSNEASIPVPDGPIESHGCQSGHATFNIETDGELDHGNIGCGVSDVSFPVRRTSATRKLISAKADEFIPSGLQSRVSTWIDTNVDDSQQTDSGQNEGSLKSHSPSNVDTVEERPRPTITRNAKRSLRLDNLAPDTLISDVAAAVRGGQILEIYQRLREKAAIVSFVYEADAQAFFDHVRRHDLYIRAKRIDVSWSDYQKTVSGQLAWQIRGGATRNFIVRQCDQYQTTSGIKDDLEHIHDLRVVNVEFKGRDCYIQTNSISGAFFARTCMSSRHRYKRCRMDWDDDECTEPLPEVSVKSWHKDTSPAAKPAKPVNRYGFLSFDKDL